MWEGDWSIENPLGLVNDHFWKSGFCPPTEIGIKKGSLLDFKLMAPWSLRKSFLTFLVCKTGRKLEEDVHVEVGREGISNYIF